MKGKTRDFARICRLVLPVLPLAERAQD